MDLKKNKRILVVGNGSGGHFFPSFVVANKLNDLCYEIMYVVSKNRIDEKIIKNSKYEYISLPYIGLKYNLIKFIKSQLSNINKIQKYIKEQQIDIVIGFGGGLSFSAALAGLSNKCKVFVHEQNIILGRANKVLPKKVKLFSSHYINDSIKVVGNPVVCNYKPKHVDYFDVVIVFGSQGSKSLNEKFSNFIKKYQGKYRILFVCDEIIECNNKRILITKFIDNLKDYFYNTNLVFTRGGATTLAELSCCECKVCIIPSPYVVHDHQSKNALYFKKKYGALVVEEKEINEDKIYEIIENNLNEFYCYNNRIKIEKANYLDLFVKEIENEIS